MIQKGVAYKYITSIQSTPTWILSELSINDTQSLPGRTLASIYTNETLLNVLYNDETPSGSTNDYLGHTKGALVYDTKGYWLIHSVPSYPPTNSYSYPQTGTTYGQNFLCISLDLVNIDLVGKQFTFNEPNFYQKVINDSLKPVLPNVVLATSKMFVKTAPYYNIQNITSVNQTSFVSFAKSHQFGLDLYADLVGPELKSNLLVESWLRGTGRLPSDCVNRTYTTQNIQEVNVTGVDFNSLNDHSKWAVTTMMNNSWICVGDINRAVSIIMKNDQGFKVLRVEDNKINWFLKFCVKMFLFFREKFYYYFYIIS